MVKDSHIFFNLESKLKMTSIEDIKKRIDLLGLKKSHVAKKIGASDSELSHYLNGNRKLNKDKLFKLNSYLGFN